MAAEVEMIENNECEIKATLEYRVNKMSNVEINKQYLVEFKNGTQTEMRKCLRCDLLVKAPNGGTTGLNKHYKSCVKKVPKRKDNSQSCLGFPKSPKLELPKGLKLVAQMVYKDQIPVNTVANSSALCVKTILLRDPDRDILTIGEDDNEQIVNGEFLEVVDVVRRITGKVHSTPKKANALEKIQRDSGKVPL